MADSGRALARSPLQGCAAGLYDELDPSQQRRPDRHRLGRPHRPAAARRAGSAPGSAAALRAAADRRQAWCALGAAGAGGRGAIPDLDRRRHAPPRQLPGPARGQAGHRHRPGAAGPPQGRKGGAWRAARAARGADQQRRAAGAGSPGADQGDIACYYAAMADLVLPYVAGRPLSVIRCPERLDQGCFYQRHLAAGMPPSVRSVRLPGVTARSRTWRSTTPRA